MLIENVLTILTITIFGCMIIFEKGSSPSPKSFFDWRTKIQRGDTLLAGCLVLCLLLIWIPFLAR